MEIPKLNKYEITELNLEELKTLMVLYDNPQLKREAKHQTNYWKQNLNLRNLIITKCKDVYGEIGTIVLSLNGSPPRCRAIITKYQSNQELVLISNKKISLSYRIKLKDFDLK